MDTSRPAPPQLFKDFELRQEARFEEITNSYKEAHDALNFDINNLKDDLEQVKTELKQTILKLDDLENRNRRNNVVIFNHPEGSEGPSCIDFNKTMTVASLTVPGEQELHFSLFSPNLIFFSYFPQTLLIFFLILALRVG